MAWIETRTSRTARRVGALLCALALQAASAMAEPRKLVLEIEGETRDYYLFVPELEPESTPRPVLVLFHGSGRDGLSILEPWLEIATREGIVLLAPESRDPKVWIAPADGPDLLYDLLEEAGATVAIDPSRLYLFGHSGGASFALQMAIAEPRFFAAAAIHAGRLYPQSHPMADAATRKIPILIAVGTQDQFFPLDRVRETHAQLAARDFPVEMWEIRGHDHDYYSRASTINERSWEYLSRQRLDGEPDWIWYEFE